MNRLFAVRQFLHVGAALRLIWKGSGILAIASIGLVIVQGLIPLPSLYLIKQLIDTVATAGAVAAVGFEQTALIIGLLLVVALIGTVAGVLSTVVNELQMQKVTDCIFDLLHAKSLELDLEYYENAQYYDLLHRAQRQAAYRPARIHSSLVQVGQNGISLLVVVGLLLSVDYVITLLLVVLMLPVFLVRIAYAEKMFHWEHRVTRTERKAGYFNFLLTEDTHAKEIRLYNLGDLFQLRFRTLRKELRRDRFRLIGYRAVFELLAEALALVAMFGAIAYVAYRAVHGYISLGELVLYLQAFQRTQTSLFSLASGMATLHENALFLSNLDEFLKLTPVVTDPMNPRPVPKPIRRGIRFDRVSFKYPSAGSKALDDISLVLEPGRMVALVGENGSGKTTLIKLLCRLYEPVAGTITLDDVDLRQFELSALRGEISVLFQDYARYHLTVRENIALGYSTEENLDKVVTAARHSGADEFISCLPEGYETQLGKRFDEGTDLSMGQWQKIALARALLRDSQIIVLDEPTSALDPEAEFRIFEKFRQQIGDRIVVLISHRLSNVRIADLICVLKHGKIAEMGSHEELMGKAGLYARMFSLQAQNYHYSGE
jgi:ATP-binding cassette subfamily B protein